MSTSGDESRSRAAHARRAASVTEAVIGAVRRASAGDRLFPHGVGRVEVVVDRDTVRVVVSDLAAAPAPAPGALQRAESAALVIDSRVQWNYAGHGIIALLAARHLDATRPDVMAKVRELLDQDRRGRADLPTLAAWPDAVKHQPNSPYPGSGDWHFIDIPYDPDDPARPMVFPGEPHVLGAIRDQLEAFKTAVDTTRKADALAFIVHLVGDLHQPLHCATRITPDHPAPKGDKGGNGFAIVGPRTRSSPMGRPRRVTELHGLWDAGLSLNIGPDDTLEDFADALLRDHPRGDLTDRLAITDPVEWAKESTMLARTVVYQGIEEDIHSPPEPSDAYYARLTTITAVQGALAAYRLADMLTTLFLPCPASPAT